MFGKVKVKTVDDEYMFEYLEAEVVVKDNCLWIEHENIYHINRIITAFPMDRIVRFECFDEKD